MKLVTFSASFERPIFELCLWRLGASFLPGYMFVNLFNQLVNFWDGEVIGEGDVGLLEIEEAEVFEEREKEKTFAGS